MWWEIAFWFEHLKTADLIFIIIIKVIAKIDAIRFDLIWIFSIFQEKKNKYRHSSLMSKDNNTKTKKLHWHQIGRKETWHSFICHIFYPLDIITVALLRISLSFLSLLFFRLLLRSVAAFAVCSIHQAFGFLVLCVGFNVLWREGRGGLYLNPRNVH